MCYLCVRSGHFEIGSPDIAQGKELSGEPLFERPTQGFWLVLGVKNNARNNAKGKPPAHLPGSARLNGRPTDPNIFDFKAFTAERQPGINYYRLYFARIGRGLVFASDARALFASGLIRPEPEPMAVDAYLCLSRREARAGFRPELLYARREVLRNTKRAIPQTISARVPGSGVAETENSPPQVERVAIAGYDTVWR